MSSMKQVPFDLPGVGQEVYAFWNYRGEKIMRRAKMIFQPAWGRMGGTWELSDGTECVVAPHEWKEIPS